MLPALRRRLQEGDFNCTHAVSAAATCKTLHSLLLIVGVSTLPGSSTVTLAHRGFQSELNWNVFCADSPALQRQAVHVESEEEVKDSSTQSRGWVKKAGAADVRTSAADFAQTLRPEKP